MLNCFNATNLLVRHGLVFLRLEPVDDEIKTGKIGAAPVLRRQRPRVQLLSGAPELYRTKSVISEFPT